VRRAKPGHAERGPWRVCVRWEVGEPCRMNVEHECGFEAGVIPALYPDSNHEVPLANLVQHMEDRHEVFPLIAE
jgi:hypothetical protein